MPRFAADLDDEDEYNYSPEPSFYNSGPGNDYRTPRYDLKKMVQSTSVRLVCRSNDQKFLFSLREGSFIEALPLVLDEFEDRTDSSASKLPASILVELTDTVKNTLRIDPPLELLCVEGEGSSRADQTDGRRSLPRLCLYTSRDVFLLEMHYEPQPSGQPVRGTMTSVTQPFEKYLAASLSHNIIRVRPAPQKSSGFAVMCPGCSMCALIENTDVQEYSLLLRHSDGGITRPLVFSMEDLDDRTMEFIVDFTFARSSGLSLLSSMTVIFLKGSGDLYSASPIVFDGCVVPISTLKEAVDFVEATTAGLDSSQPKWRQYTVVNRYLLEAFGDYRDQSLSNNQFATANITSMSSREASTVAFPVKCQGPILLAGSLESTTPAVTLECFGGGENLVGLAIARAGGYEVDFAAVSPTALISRFTYEPRSDTFALDDDIWKLGAWLEQVDVTEDHGSALEKSVALLNDPLVDSLIHVATPSFVVTLSTNAIQRAARKPTKFAPPESSTSAWVSFQTKSDATKLQGIAVCAESLEGHNLITVEQNGNRSDVSITELQLAHEVQKAFVAGSQSEALAITAGTEGNISPFESTRPLYEVTRPLIDKIIAGLAAMGKYVGPETNYQDIQADYLAVVQQVRERCDKDLIVPLIELRSIVSSHKEILRKTVEGQQKQMEVLITTRNSQAQINSQLAAKIDAVEANAATLLERATRSLEMCKDLTPTVSDAELQFFNDIKRLKLKSDSMADDLRLTKEKVSTQCQSLDSLGRPLNIQLEPEKVRQANVLLRDSDRILQDVKESVARSEAMLDLMKEE
ncbi:hypothetical protein FisN_1Hh467 [Fistulifera solaris]|uniref:Nuclear pore complex protein Nup88 n=1 Tax=Fistulifera solaris TaxID=1519565 RepID=A0A1Z5JK95_FISSO|nr:hypothetical protein FisN_1Hh467 [Fistulifera solaris]|eukprot:GAX14272.1 hypothetical protein FisN_1Hh467 [Fistulifera solaris]